MTARADPVLAYGFAKDQGVVLLDGRADGPAVLGVRPDAPGPAILEARRVLGRPVRLSPMDADAFDRTLSELYASAGFEGSDFSDSVSEEDDLSALAEGLPETADLLDTDDNAPVIRLINGLLSEAVKRKASDVHVEPYEDRLSVRLRVDGVLQEVLSLPRKLTAVIVSRIKVMARLDIAEKRIPQDGRISLTLGGRAVDVRVSTLPARYGERVVMRLLDKDAARLDLVDLGMPETTLERFAYALAEPNGVILVTGPTGSGKTTTLYAALERLNDQSRNILTVEDPIEYGLNGVGQTQVNAKVGLSFAAGLRAILRQDPDVVMVGEIRDVETAQIAVQASLTGHLVLSTVHTNSAAAAVTRLRDMGVEPFLLASTVRAVLAQRLVRRLCDHCKTPYAPTARERALLGVSADDEQPFYRAKGCPECGGLGYRGRIGVYELLVVDETVRQLIHDEGQETAISAAGLKGADTLLQSGARLVLAGKTSVDEVLRVARTGGDEDGDV
ncbi:MAG: type II secretion system ATPase GspE [Maricaulaceae bacterium]